MHPRQWDENTTEIMVMKFRVMTVVSEVLPKRESLSHRRVQGPFLATKHFFPSLKTSEAARIVNFPPIMHQSQVIYSSVIEGTFKLLQ